MPFDNPKQLAESVRSSLDSGAPANWRWDSAEITDELLVWRAPVGAVDVLVRATSTGPEAAEVEALAEIRCETGIEAAQMRRELDARECHPAPADLQMAAEIALDDISVQVIELASDFGSWAVAPDSDGPDFSCVAMPESFKAQLEEAKADRARASEKARKLQAALDTLADNREVHVATVAIEDGEITAVTSSEVDEARLARLLADNLEWVEAAADD